MIELSLLCFDRLHMDSLLPRILPLVDSVHMDIMDGHFTADPGGYSPEFISGFATDLPKHVHAMSVSPASYLPQLDGIATYSFHIEAVDDPSFVLDALDERGISAGIVLNPETPVERITPWLPRLGRVILMAVPPGKSGQPYLVRTSQKLTQLRALDANVEIVIDGGMHTNTIREVRELGADSMVVCSVIVKAADPEGKVAQLRQAIDGNRQRRA